MKISKFLIFLLFTINSISLSQLHIGAKFTPKLSATKPDSAWFGDIGIRAAHISDDIDKDGKPELWVTDYTKLGRVHAFQAIGNDSLEWVWSSPRLQTLGGGSTPRVIRSGDLDGDGKGEVVFPNSGIGLNVFEWDGVVGSHKFGTKPSATLTSLVTYASTMGALAGLPVEGGIQTTIENFEISDVDKDGQQEILLPKNVTGTVNDDFLIISAQGDWSFEDPGFSSFQIEGSSYRLVVSKFGGGSPYAMQVADLNGDGKNEIVCQPWNFGNYFVIKVNGPNSYSIPDTLKEKIFYYQCKTFDNIALFGLVTGDFDKDKNQEVYFPWYSSENNIYTGGLSMLDYSTSDVVTEADSTHSFLVAPNISLNTSGVNISSFYATIGDLDRNGKPELLVGSAFPSNIVAVEYKGTGSIRDPNNYLRKVLYKGEADTYSAISYRDSAGTKDTVYTIGEGFVSKQSKVIDFDKDGKLEMILPYQSVADTTSIRWVHHNGIDFIEDSVKGRLNSKKWNFRSLEADVVGDVKPFEYVVITPDDYELFQNYPNPFNPSTKISFKLPLNKNISLIIYDALGKEVNKLIDNKFYQHGKHEITWNGTNSNNKSVTSGTYFYKLVSDNVEKSGKMILLK